MRLTLDVTPVLLRSAGVKNYVWHWAWHLQRTRAGNRVSMFPALDELPELNHESSGFHLAGTYARLALLHFSNIRGNPALGWMQRSTDVFHASWQLQNPPRNCRVTATLYDLTCWRFAHLHTAANVAAAKRFAARVLRRADGAIAISEATAMDASDILGLPRDRIAVIYPGVSAAYFQVAAGEIARVRQQYRLDKPYLLTVGTIEPRKNIARSLDAWAALPARFREHYNYVFAGPRGWHDEELAQRLENGASAVRYLGYVDERDLPALTAGATAFLYASLFEGFGFPLAQAMAAGVPCVTSNVSSMPEVAAESALLVDPGEVEEIAGALARLLDSDSLQASLAGCARNVAERYRWEECARLSWEFFERIARE